MSYGRKGSHTVKMRLPIVLLLMLVSGTLLLPNFGSQRGLVFADAFSGPIDYSGDVCYSSSSFLRYSTTVIASIPPDSTATILYQTPTQSSEFTVRCLHVYETPPMDANGAVIYNPFWSACVGVKQIPLQVCSSDTDVFAGNRDATTGSPTRYTLNVSAVSSECVEVSETYFASPSSVKQFGFPNGPKKFWRVQRGLYMYGTSASSTEGERCYPYWTHFVALISEANERDTGAPMVWIIVVCVAVFVVLLLAGFFGLLFCSDSFRRLLKIRPRRAAHLKDLPQYHHALSPPSAQRGVHNDTHGFGEVSNKSIDSVIYAGQALDDLPPLQSEMVRRGLSLSAGRASDNSSVFSPTRHVPRATTAAVFTTAQSPYSPQRNANTNRAKEGTNGGVYQPSPAQRITYDSKEMMHSPHATTDDQGQGQGGGGRGASPTGAYSRRLDNDASFQQSEPLFYSDALGCSVGGRLAGGAVSPSDRTRTDRPQPPLPNDAYVGSPDALGNLGSAYYGNTPLPPTRSSESHTTGTSRSLNIDAFEIEIDGAMKRRGEEGPRQRPSLYEETMASEAKRLKLPTSSTPKTSSPIRSPWLDVVAEAEGGAGGTVLLTMGSESDDDKSFKGNASPRNNSIQRDREGNLQPSFRSTVGLRPPAHELATRASRRRGTSNGNGGGLVQLEENVIPQFEEEEGGTASPKKHRPSGYAPAPDFFTSYPANGVYPTGISDTYPPPNPLQSLQRAEQLREGQQKRHISFVDDDDARERHPQLENRGHYDGHTTYSSNVANRVPHASVASPLPAASNPPSFFFDMYSPLKSSDVTSNSASPPGSGSYFPTSTLVGSSTTFGRQRERVSGTGASEGNLYRGETPRGEAQFTYTDNSATDLSPPRPFSSPLKHLNYGGGVGVHHRDPHAYDSLTLGARRGVAHHNDDESGVMDEDYNRL